MSLNWIESPYDDSVSMSRGVRRVLQPGRMAEMLYGFEVSCVGRMGAVAMVEKWRMFVC